MYSVGRHAKFITMSEGSSFYSKLGFFFFSLLSLLLAALHHLNALTRQVRPVRGHKSGSVVVPFIPV